MQLSASSSGVLKLHEARAQHRGTKHDSFSVGNFFSLNLGLPSWGCDPYTVNGKPQRPIWEKIFCN